MKQINRIKIIFTVYLVLVVGYFTYAGFTGTRMIGDDKEEYKPSGHAGHTAGGYRSNYRYYHK